MSTTGAGMTTAQSAERYDSAATSVNGSTDATDTTTNTEISSTNEDVVRNSQTGESVVQKSASVPPKVNPWKTRPQQSIASKSCGNTTPAQSHQETAEKSSYQESKSEDSNGHSQSVRRTHRPSKSAAPAIDDASLWPTLDRALKESTDSQQKKAPVEGSEANSHSAPRISGKEKWTKITPTIIHAPIPSKSYRSGAGAASPKNTGRAGATQRNSRERHNSEKSDAGVETSPKQSRSSETSQSRSVKGRSMSVSHPRSERLPRREGQAETEASVGAGYRSHSSKRSDRGSISAPSGNTPVSEAAKSPQALNGFPGDVGTHGNGGEPRLHRGSYDSNIGTRPRPGGYRGPRGHYQGNYNTRYQNPANYVAQSQMPNNRMYQRDQMPYGFDQYQNFVNPAIAPMMIDPMVARHMVLGQCEYYFSIENLCKDLFLRKHMDAEGFVNLPILANFNRVRAITLDYALIRDVCMTSTLIELRVVPGSYDKIRRAEGWEHWILPEDQRDPSTKAVPEPVLEIPVTSAEEPQGDMSSNIGAKAFVPGQLTDQAQSGTTTLNENFANLGIGRKLSPEVKEFQSQKAVSKTE